MCTLQQTIKVDVMTTIGGTTRTIVVTR